MSDYCCCKVLGIIGNLNENLMDGYGNIFCNLFENFLFNKGCYINVMCCLIFEYFLVILSG